MTTQPCREGRGIVYFLKIFPLWYEKKSSLLISLFQGCAHVSMTVHCSLVLVQFFWIKLDNWLLAAAIFRLIFSNVWAVPPSPWYSHYSLKQTSSLLKNQFIVPWRYHHLRSSQGMLYPICGSGPWHLLIIKQKFSLLTIYIMLSKKSFMVVESKSTAHCKALIPWARKPSKDNF